MDPLGNLVCKRPYTPGGEGTANDSPDFLYTLNAVYGSVRSIALVDVTTSSHLNDDTFRSYDVSGNVAAGIQGWRRSRPGTWT